MRELTDWWTYWSDVATHFWHSSTVHWKPPTNTTLYSSSDTKVSHWQIVIGVGANRNCFILLFSHFSELLLFMIFWSLFILLNAHNISSQPVSFFPRDAMSVCHKPVLYRNGWMDQADFWHRGYSWLTLHCVVREFGYLQNRGHFSLELCPKLWTQKNIQISPWHMDLRKCCHYLVHTEHPPSCITR